MAETLSLTTPQDALTATGVWHVEYTLLRRGWTVNGTVLTADPANSRIVIGLIGEYGHRREHPYSGATADALILALNKANLSSISLEKRIMNQLIADGFEAGTITGSPD